MNEFNDTYNALLENEDDRDEKMTHEARSITAALLMIIERLDNIYHGLPS